MMAEIAITNSTRVRYIKLGEKAVWAKNCLSQEIDAPERHR
jgi:hypothetical protein